MLTYVILAKTSSWQIFEMTNNLIMSLQKTIYPLNGDFSKYKILVIETQKNCRYIYDDVISLNYINTKFNYNSTLNFAIDFIGERTDWFCFMNNDITVDPNWIIEINNSYNNHKDLLSICPNSNKIQNDVEYGYTLFKHMLGYCFFVNKKVFSIIGRFDENFDFYYQDDDYIEQCRIYNIPHAAIKKSIIYHIGQQTTGNSNKFKLNKDKQIFIQKYGYNLFKKREQEKHIVLIQK